MICKAKTIEIKTHKQTEIINISKKVQDYIDELNVKDGIITVYAKHTTARVVINENEELLLKDLEVFLEKIAPWACKYEHDEILRRDCPPDERINAAAHCRALFMSASETIPIKDGKLDLGIWQSVFFFDLDGGHRLREVVLQVIGN